MSAVVEIYVEALAPATAPSTNSKEAPLVVQPETSTLIGNENSHRLTQEVESWLPMTESRKGSTWTATFHLISSGIGTQVLGLPFAFVKLGWYVGILSLLLIYVWQLYTKFLLVNLHESPNGIRYNGYLHISVAAFGPRMGKLLAIFPVMYLSGGTCALFIITGGAMMKQFFQLVNCDGGTHCNSSLNGPEWFLIFICLAILIAQFFPNLDSLARLSLVGSLAAVLYCTLIWTLSISKSRLNMNQPDQLLEEKSTSEINKFRDVLSAIGIIALTFRGHNVILEIQGTIPSSGKHKSKKPMWRGVIISYVVIMVCLFPVAIGGYWAYGDKLSSSGGGILNYDQHHHELKWVLAIIYMMVLIHYMSAFQIYAMVVFDNLERIYVTKNNKPCPRWIRSGIKLFFGGLTYLIAMAFPFLPILGAFIGGIALPLTFAYPCFIWIAIKRKESSNLPRKIRTRMWYVNMVIGSLGVLMSVAVIAAALWSLVDNKFEANFFKPLA